MNTLTAEKPLVDTYTVRVFDPVALRYVDLVMTEAEMQTYLDLHLGR